MNNDHYFLSRVAQFCMGGGAGCDPADIAFVLPNKRAVLFLKKYVRDRMQGVAMLPRFMTMRSFLGRFSPKASGTDMKLLFLLYDAYRNVLRSRGRAGATREFDAFVFWGDMMLNDFNEIDKSFVRADELFKNLKDTKEILADYLNDEQKEVIRQIWGESRLTTSVTEFWAHLSTDAPEQSVSAKFLYLWEIMADIYNEFHRLSDKNGIASEGEEYKAAVDGVRAMCEGDDDGTRYAFVGFNDLTHAETLILERLNRSSRACFFWDMAAFKLFPANIELPASLQRLSRLAKHFRMPEGFELNAPAGMPDVTVTAVPSNVAQAKAAGIVLDEWVKDGTIDPSKQLATAIVLPDQGLLLPLLMAIPSSVPAVNITMGLAYRTTTFATLLHSIISMHMRARMRNGIYTFYFKDVIEVLQHPHIQAVAADAARTVSDYITDQRIYNLPATEVASIAPGLKKVFTPLHEQNNVVQVEEYLVALLNWLEQELSLAGGPRPSFELDAITYFRSELQNISALVKEHDVSMANHTFLQLFERVLGARALSLNGKPLQGLQVMGVLETRALDFDNVIILSMNDGVFPRKQYARTMIPNNLRKGYALPDFESQEWTYSYAFFRLIARAKNVAIFYDARADGKGKGEPSRYLRQMKYLMPELKIRQRQMIVGSTAVAKNVFEVTKTPSVLAELERFKSGGDLRMSAAALKQYMACPFSFYLQYVRGLRGNDDMVDYLTSANYGTVVHNTIEKVFAPMKDCVITAADYDRWLAADNTMIEEIITDQLLTVRRHVGAQPKLDSEESIALEAIAHIVRSNLVAERNKYCNPDFVFVDNEFCVKSEKYGLWEIDDDLAVNFTMSIDRVDRTSAKELRFIDFKTGEEDTSSEFIESLFARGMSAKRGLFQVLTYCEAYLSMVDADVSIRPFIHPMRELVKKDVIPDVRISKVPVTDYKDIRDRFRPELHRLFHEIFDANDVPFYQTDDLDVCEYCNFASLCGRMKK